MCNEMLFFFLVPRGGGKKKVVSPSFLIILSRWAIFHPPAAGQRSLWPHQGHGSVGAEQGAHHGHLPGNRGHPEPHHAGPGPGGHLPQGHRRYPAKDQINYKLRRNLLSFFSFRCTLALPALNDVEIPSVQVRRRSGSVARFEIPPCAVLFAHLRLLSTIQTG